MSTIKKIKKASLVGRGGACFPVWQKWQAVKDATIKIVPGVINPKAGKYVVCNCSEGEPGVKKDAYLIEKYADRIIDGMRLAIEFLTAEKGIFYINEIYYKKYQKTLEAAIKQSGAPIELFKKPHTAGYVGGEETTVLNVIEGKRAEPRLRPPYPVTEGLWGMPTLVNNVETFYNVSLVDRGDYEKKRYYSLSGDILFEGVFELPESHSIENILEETKNLPKFNFFVQVGGDGSGEVLNQSQLGIQASGCGSIHVYSMSKYKPQELMRSWVTFFANESCGKCTSCREGTHRLVDILSEDKPDWKLVSEILNNLSESAFCGLGCAVPIPIRSYVKNVLKNTNDTEIKMLLGEKKLMCDCLS